LIGWDFWHEGMPWLLSVINDFYYNNNDDTDSCHHG
jgi:hypothetical protein